MGDLNVDLMRHNRKTELLEDMLDAFCLSQLVKKPTRVTKTSASLLDIICVTNFDLSVGAVTHIDMHETTDHQLVCVELKTTIPKATAKVRMEKCSYLNSVSQERHNKKTLNALKTLKVYSNKDFNFIPPSLGDPEDINAYFIDSVDNLGCQTDPELPEVSSRVDFRLCFGPANDIAENVFPRAAKNVQVKAIKLERIRNKIPKNKTAVHITWLGENTTLTSSTSTALEPERITEADDSVTLTSKSKSQPVTSSMEQSKFLYIITLTLFF
nr:unnamed protein product [Callosobruchus analis]